MFELLFILLCGHALADFALQGDAMAKGKNRHNKNIPPKGQKLMLCWFYWLTAHALIHGLMVALLINSNICYSSICTYSFLYGTWKYGLVAAGLHWIIDFAKCENWTNPHIDQLLHVLTIVAIIIYFNYF